LSRMSFVKYCMPQYIYESPDQGKTIYRREVGKKDKSLVQTSIETERTNRWLIWQSILIASEQNEALKEALDRAQVIYELSRK